MTVCALLFLGTRVMKLGNVLLNDMYTQMYATRYHVLFSGWVFGFFVTLQLVNRTIYSAMTSLCITVKVRHDTHAMDRKSTVNRRSTVDRKSTVD